MISRFGYIMLTMVTFSVLYGVQNEQKIQVNIFDPLNRYLHFHISFIDKEYLNFSTARQNAFK